MKNNLHKNTIFEMFGTVFESSESKTKKLLDALSAFDKKNYFFTEEYVRNLTDNETIELCQNLYRTCPLFSRNSSTQNLCEKIADVLSLKKPSDVFMTKIPKIEIIFDNGDIFAEMDDDTYRCTILYTLTKKDIEEIIIEYQNVMADNHVMLLLFCGFIASKHYFDKNFFETLKLDLDTLIREIYRYAPGNIYDYKLKCISKKLTLNSTNTVKVFVPLECVQYDPDVTPINIMENTLGFLNKKQLIYDIATFYPTHIRELYKAERIEMTDDITLGILKYLKSNTNSSVPVFDLCIMGGYLSDNINDAYVTSFLEGTLEHNTFYHIVFYMCSIYDKPHKFGNYVNNNLKFNVIEILINLYIKSKNVKYLTAIQQVFNVKFVPLHKNTQSSIYLLRNYLIFTNKLNLYENITTQIYFNKNYERKLVSTVSKRSKRVYEPSVLNKNGKTVIKFSDDKKNDIYLFPTSDYIHVRKFEILFPQEMIGNSDSLVIDNITYKKYNLTKGDINISLYEEDEHVSIDEKRSIIIAFEESRKKRVEEYEKNKKKEEENIINLTNSSFDEINKNFENLINEKEIGKNAYNKIKQIIKDTISISGKKINYNEIFNIFEESYKITQNYEKYKNSVRMLERSSPTVKYISEEEEKVNSYLEKLDKKNQEYRKNSSLIERISNNKRKNVYIEKDIDEKRKINEKILKEIEEIKNNLKELEVKTSYDDDRKKLENIDNVLNKIKENIKETRSPIRETRMSPKNISNTPTLPFSRIDRKQVVNNIKKFMENVDDVIKKSEYFKKLQENIIMFSKSPTDRLYREIIYTPKNILSLSDPTLEIIKKHKPSFFEANKNFDIFTTQLSEFIDLKIITFLFDLEYSNSDLFEKAKSIVSHINKIPKKEKVRKREHVFLKRGSSSDDDDDYTNDDIKMWNEYLKRLLTSLA